MRRLLILIAAVLGLSTLATALTAVAPADSPIAPSTAEATCYPEPLAGDLYVYSASHTGVYIDVEGTRYTVPRGQFSDNIIPSGRCKDVDFFYVPSGYDAFTLLTSGSWSRVVTATGWSRWHLDNGGLARVALFNCANTSLC